LPYDARKPENASRTLAEIRRIIDASAGPQVGKLPTERELCDRLGTGRRSVRRALDALEAEGLIWRRQGKGTFIGQAPDPTAAFAAEIAGETDLLSVMEARIVIEPALAELCARRATGDDVARLRVLAERTTNASDADTTELWDGSLHRLIARVAGNRILMASFTLLDEVRMGDDWQTQRHRARTPETMTLYDGQHRAIIDAIQKRDGPGARAAMTAHLLSLQTNLASAMQDGAA
jgi:DNA-binding FadR family transcriptional regulator